ncbi:Gfo/Idh/MocA family oxidoreductase [uncultured Sphaerochaeta sp.]|uniref:Gfo/Idh/MocA family protein n=1 Tax=uncultured Sphaerochaeta sp. TaxID=886478 RepID=UPI002A0A90B9|nr:Gfo/Idh/MocA family oxidoreductase [uncultured Sphaerochaeta sp.]
MENKYKVGLVGAGSIAEIAHLPILAKREDVEMTGVMALHIESAMKAKQKHSIKHAVATLPELIDLGIDCAFVLSPKDCHPRQVIELLNAGIDVFCEKPMGCNLREMEEMANTAERTGKTLMIGFNRRYSPVYRKAKELYGNTTPDVIIAQKNRPASEYRATLENAIHMVDLLRYFCGECTHIEAHSIYKDPYYETLTTAQLQFENGTIGILVADRASGQWIETFQMHGKNRTVTVDCPDSITIVDSKESHTTNMTPLAMGWARVEDKMGFQAEDDHFFDCLKHNKTPLTNAADAFKTHELMHRILQIAGLPDLA